MRPPADPLRWPAFRQPIRLLAVAGIAAAVVVAPAVLKRFSGGGGNEAQATGGVLVRVELKPSEWPEGTTWEQVAARYRLSNDLFSATLAANIRAGQDCPSPKDPAPRHLIVALSPNPEVQCPTR